VSLRGVSLVAFRSCRTLFIEFLGFFPCFLDFHQCPLVQSINRFRFFRTFPYLFTRVGLLSFPNPGSQRLLPGLLSLGCTEGLFSPIFLSFSCILSMIPLPPEPFPVVFPGSVYLIVAELFSASVHVPVVQGYVLFLFFHLLSARLGSCDVCPPSFPDDLSANVLCACVRESTSPFPLTPFLPPPPPAPPRDSLVLTHPVIGVSCRCRKPVFFFPPSVASVLDRLVVSSGRGPGFWLCRYASPHPTLLHGSPATCCR